VRGGAQGRHLHHSTDLWSSRQLNRFRSTSWPYLTLGRPAAPSYLSSFRGPSQKARRHGRRSDEGSLPIFLPPYSLTSIPSSGFSSTSINSCEKPGAHKHLDSVPVTPNLKRRLSEFTNKGSAHAIAGAKAHFLRYHVNRVQAVF
jgi:hypothetical protein